MANKNHVNTAVRLNLVNPFSPTLFWLWQTESIKAFSTILV